MASDLPSTLNLVVLNDYASLFVVTAVGYDYVLTFSAEVEYIWCRPWSWVSTMFVIIRYVGLLSVMIAALNGSAFFPGPLEVSLVLNIVGFWVFYAFLFATDYVMILRVYTMWNRSRIILYFLLFIYVVQFIISIVLNGIYDNSGHLSSTVVQVSTYTFCNSLFFNLPSMFNQLISVPRFVFAAVLVILAVIQTLKQLVEMYQATKKWQLNCYMQLLIKDGILYFLANVFYQLNGLLVVELNIIPSDTLSLFLTTLSYVALYPLVPWLIISIRELYDHQTCCHIDTGFGVRSRSDAYPDATVSAMVFVDTDQGGQDRAGEEDTEIAGDIEEVSRVPVQV